MVAGISPDGYRAFNVPPSSSSNNDSTETIYYSVGGLETGVNYTVRVSSADNESGFGHSTESHQPVSPKGVPGIIPGVLLTILDDKTLHLVWDQSESDNGSPVSSYIVEWDMSITFSDPTRMEVSPAAHIQAVRTDAWERGWLSGAYFTLSLLSFKGSFHSSDLGGNAAATYVSVSNSSSSISVNGNNLWNDAGTDLGKVIRRGELFRVAGQEFSACLSLDEIHDSTTVSLCDPMDARVPTTFIITSDSFFYGWDDTFAHVPVFKLDTSVGQVVEPRVGGYRFEVDVEIDDLRNVLSLGDFLRIGRPDTGRIVRVCEASTALSATSIDICEEVNATKTAYLEAVDLYGISTHQVQELELIVDSSNPGFDPDTSYRLMVGSDVSQDCTLIGADPSDLEIFIKGSFDVVDDVEVSLTTTLDSATVTTYTYSITYVGNNVPGATDTVEPIDIGLNGCPGSPFGISSSSNVISPSTVPLYRVQTSPNIAWDASSDDVRAAVTSLSGVCDVSVERSVRGGGFEWLITFDGSHREMLTAMRPNGYGLDHDLAYVEPEISVVAIGSLDLPVNASGVPHFARISAVNEVGVGPVVSSTPTFASASIQPPKPPKQVIVAPYDGLHRLMLQWDPPSREDGNINGEGVISEYLVEWDFSRDFDSADRQSQRISSNEVGSLLDVQSIVVSVSEGHYLAGSWSLSIDGQTTAELPHDATADQVAQALQSLCTVGSVNVWRTIGDGGAPQYLVTFVDMPHSGSQIVPANSPDIETKSGHRLSVNGEHLYTCEHSDLTTCLPSGATAIVGSQPEVQRFACNPNGTYPFRVSFGGGGGHPSLYPSVAMTSTATAGEIEMSLRVFLGKVSVSIDGGAPGMGALSCEGSGSYVDVTFLDFIGDAPMMLSDELATPIVEVTKGVSQTVRGQKSYSIVLDVLTDPSLPVYARVTGYSPAGGYGTGAVVATYVSDTTIVYPTPPLSVAIQLDTSSNKADALVSWLHKEDFDELTSWVDGYRIEWDTTPTFSSSCGDGAEVQTLTATSSAVHTGETFSLIVGIGGDTILSCATWDISATTVQAAFVAAGYIGTTVTRSGDGSLSWGYGYRWNIAFNDSVPVGVPELQAESCGTGSDFITWTVTTEHEGRPIGDCMAANHVPLGFKHTSISEASTTDSDTFETHLTNVPLGVDVYVRVASTAYLSRGEILQSDWTYAMLPPDVPYRHVPLPGLPERVSLTAIGPTIAAIDFATLYGEWEGIYDNIKEFHIQLTAGSVDIYSLTVGGSLGSYTLQLSGDRSTWCLPHDATDEDIHTALLVVEPQANASASSENGSSSFTVTLPALSELKSSTCVGDAEASVLLVKEGIIESSPSVFDLNTDADENESLSGLFTVTFSSEKSPIMVYMPPAASNSNSPVTVKTVAGSRHVWCLRDLSPYLVPGDTVDILGYRVEVQGGFGCKEDTSGECCFEITRPFPESIDDTDILVSASSLGRVSVQANSNSVITAREVAGWVIPGALLNIRDSTSVTVQQVSVQSVSGTTITLNDVYTGLSSTDAALFMKQWVVVPFDVTATELKAALSTLIFDTKYGGSSGVEISRLGPTSSGGFSWAVSIDDQDAPSVSPNILHAAGSIAGGAVVTGCTEFSGSYYPLSFDQWSNGRPTMKLINRMVTIMHDGSSWGIWVHGSLSASRTPDSGEDLADTSGLPPSGTWGDCNIVFGSEVSLLDGGGVTADTVSSGIPPDFTQPLHDFFTSRTTITTDDIGSGGAAAVAEVQNILISALSEVRGTWELSYGGESLVAGWNASAFDLRQYLEELGSVGSVVVSKPADIQPQFGSRWLVTFTSPLRDLPMLTVSATPSNSRPLAGTEVTIETSEVSKGRSANGGVTEEVNTTTPVAVRVSAVNSAGEGPYKNGNAPALISAAPSPPEIVSISPLSPNHLKLDISESPDVTIFELEWAYMPSGESSSLPFGSPRVNSLKLHNDLANDTLGHFILSYGGANTKPLRWNTSSEHLREALIALPTIPEAAVSRESSTFGYTWSIIFESAKSGPVEKSGYVCHNCVTGLTETQVSLTLQEEDDISSIIPVGSQLRLEGVPCMLVVTDEVDESGNFLYEESTRTLSSDCSSLIGTNVVNTTTGLSLIFTDPQGLNAASIDLGSVSGDGVLSLMVLEGLLATFPAIRGSTALRAGDIDGGGCGGISVGSPSSVQRLIPSFSGATVGEYRVSLGGGLLTSCIDLSAPAQDVQQYLRTALNRDDIDVRGSSDSYYTVYFRGEHSTGEWPLLRGTLEHMNEYGDGSNCVPFSGGVEPPKMLTMPVTWQSPCLQGSPGAQVIIAQASDGSGEPVSGSAGVWYRGTNIGSFAFSDTPASIEQTLQGGGLDARISAFSLSGTSTSPSRLGAAWVVTIDEGSDAEGLVLSDRFTHAILGVYDIVTITTVAAEVGLTGTFRLRIGKEETEEINAMATAGKMSSALDNLEGIESAIVLSPTTGQVELALMIVLTSGSPNTLIQGSDLTDSIAPGDVVTLESSASTSPSSVVSLQFDGSDTIVVLNQTASSTGTYSAMAGPGFESRKYLGFDFVMTSVATVTSITDLLTLGLGELPDDVSISMGDTLLIGGSAITVEPTYTDSNAEVFVTMDEGPPEGFSIGLRVYLPVMTAYHTAELGTNVNIGTRLWVVNEAGDFDEIIVAAVGPETGMLSISASDATPFAGDYRRSKVFGPANGRVWTIAMKSRSVDLSTLTAVPSLDFSGLGASIRIQRSRGRDPLSFVLGSPPEIQTVALRSFEGIDTTSATWVARVGSEETEPLAWDITAT